MVFRLCPRLPRLTETGYFMVVIAPDPPAHWPSSLAMGLAPVQTGLYPRAYVFYKLVLAFIAKFRLVQSRESAIGLIMGHAVAHELGHLLMPGEAHSYGIMRHTWGYREWEEALSGSLLFNPNHAKLMRERLR